MNFFDNKDLGNHLLQLCPKVVKHPVFITLFSLEMLYNNGMSTPFFTEGNSKNVSEGMISISPCHNEVEA
jgi:hypothetical protein